MCNQVTSATLKQSTSCGEWAVPHCALTLTATCVETHIIAVRGVIGVIGVPMDRFHSHWGTVVGGRSKAFPKKCIVHSGDITGAVIIAEAVQANSVPEPNNTFISWWVFPSQDYITIWLPWQSCTHIHWCVVVVYTCGEDGTFAKLNRSCGSNVCLMRGRGFPRMHCMCVHTLRHTAHLVGHARRTDHLFYCCWYTDNSCSHRIHWCKEIDYKSPHLQ